MLGKIIAISLILAAPLSAQVVIGGQSVGGGRTVISNVGPITPPPPVGLVARLFGGIYGSSAPAWPPRDQSGAAMQQGLCRIWDSGAKISQLMTVSGPVGAHTYSFNWTPLDNIITRCKQLSPFTGAPNAPMKVIYTLGSTPCGAALAAIGTYPAGPPPCTNPGLATCPSGATCSCLQPDLAYSCAAYDDNVTGSASETDTTMLTFLSNLFAHVASLGITLDGVELQNEWDTAGFMCWNQASGCGSPVLSPHTNVNAVTNKAMVQRGWDLKATRDCKSPTTQLYSPSSHVLTVLPGEILDNLINTSTTVHALTAGQNGYPAGCPNLPSQTVFGWQVIEDVNIHPDGNPNTPESFIKSNSNLECERSAVNTCTSSVHSGPNWTHLVGLTKTGDEFGTKSGDCSSADCLGAATARRYIYCAWLGYQECAWYQLDSKGSFEALIGTQGGNAFDQLAEWILGGAPAAFAQPSGTVYTETFNNSSSVTELLVYDSSATDSNGGNTCPNTVGGAGCTTVVVPNAYTKFESLDGVVHSVNSSHQIAVGGKPVCVTTNASGC